MDVYINWIKSVVGCSELQAARVWAMMPKAHQREVANGFAYATVINLLDEGIADQREARYVVEEMLDNSGVIDMICEYYNADNSGADGLVAEYVIG